MKQLLLLFVIHIMIFYQQKKDKQEKFLNTLEKKTARHEKAQPTWDFLLLTHTVRKDSSYSPRPLSMVTYRLGDRIYPFR